MLDIRPSRSQKKGIRIDLYRKYKHTDAAGKVKFSYKHVGSFSLKQGYSSDLIAMLDGDEVLQLDNWLAEARFAEQFETEADALARFTVHMPQQFHDALSRLYTEAKRVDINFIPHQIMLESLLKSAKLVQTKIDKINGFKSGILESIGICSERLRSEENEQQLVDDESRALFKALLSLEQPIGKTCTELEEAARQLGQERRIPPPQLRDWAGDMPHRNPHKRLKKWCYALAIDVLQQHGINPLTLIKPEKVAEYWAIQRQDRYTLQEAQKIFVKTFNVPKEILSPVKEAIVNVYKRLLSTA